MNDKIKLIIELPESDYKAICANKEDAAIAHDTCRRIAKSGIPLDKVKTEIEYTGAIYQEMGELARANTIIEVLGIIDRCIGKEE